MGSFNSALMSSGSTEGLRGSKALELATGGGVVAGIFSMAIATSVLFLSRSITTKPRPPTNFHEPIRRTMLPISSLSSSESRLHRPSFTILQMNTLADSLCNAKSFPFSDPAALEWEFRKQHLVSILTEHPHDILCLQEVDKFEEYYEASLGAKGYKGIFKGKSDANPHATRDGCALFYNTTRFQVVEKRFVELSPQHSQIAILVKLRLLDDNDDDVGQDQKPQKGVVVATTHLKAKVGFEELRLQQGRALLQRIREFVQDDVQVKEWPVVVTGDFNDIPGSLVFQLFAEGAFTKEEPTTSASIEHPFNLKSAYPKDIFTTYKNRGTVVKRCIDYIWFDANRLELSERLEIPSTESMPHLLPAVYYPSDHLAIAAKFVWRPTETEQLIDADADNKKVSSL
eukprot:TRINITY_DN3141_c0_g1_i1.p1 TRINITY_DN3141_c0_g1~~TRINITY_DN3141_c0_g1_i1.p1  ORF type:complete len:400 (-),score=97.24 TRINITY_DN3141_c0_g1_i1:147-1346(-)